MDKQKKVNISAKVTSFIALSILAAFVLFSLLHGRHTGVYFPWLNGFSVLPLRHWVVFTAAMVLSICVLYFGIIKTEIVKQLPGLVIKKMKSPDLNEKLLLLTLLSIIIIIFGYMLRNIALATHDDIWSYIYLTTTSWPDYMVQLVDSLAARGRLALTSFFVQSLTWIVYNLQSMVIYTLFSYIPIVVNAGVFAYIVSKRTNKYIGYLIVVLFFMYAQIDFQHNLFVAYPFGFNFRLFMFLLSVEFFLQHFESEKKHRLLISALLMFSTFFGYESFLTYFVLFPAFLLCKSLNGKSLKATLNDFLRSLLILKYHVVAVALFLINYIIIPRIFDVDLQYYGTTIAFDRMSIQSVLTILWYFSTDLFPLNNFVRFGFIRNLDISQVSIEMVLIAFCATIVCCYLLMKNIEITGKKVLGICFISLIGAFIFSFPHALSKHSHMFIFDWGFTGFVTSYFSYFWFILIIAVLLIYAYKLLKFRKLLLLIIAPIVFVTTIFTSISNDYFIRQHEDNLTRYKAFSSIFSSEFAANIEDGAYIYVREFVGVHHFLQMNARYVYHLSGREVNFSRNFEDIAHESNRYFLNYCGINNFIMLGKICPETADLAGDKLFIMPTTPMQNAGFIGLKSSEVSPVTINGIIMSEHNHSINIPLSYIGMNGILVEADGLLFEHVTITDTEIPSNDWWVVQRPIPFDSYIDSETRFFRSLSDGWSFIEYWGVWSDGHTAELNFQISADNIVDSEELEFVFSLNIFPESIFFAVYINDYFAAEHILANGVHTITVPVAGDILAETDAHEDFIDVSIRFEIANPLSPYALEASTDARELGIGLQWFSLRAAE
jgi:hypothetical protein